MSIDPIAIVRSAHLAASVLAAGTAAFTALIAKPRPALRRRFIAMIWAALAVAIVTGALWLSLLAADLTGDPFPAPTGVWIVLTATRFGAVAVIRLVLALVLAALVVWPGASWLALFAAAGFIGLLGLVGHAGATAEPAGVLLLANDMAHLAAAGAWLGGLPALALLLADAQARERAAHANAAAAVRRFGALGLGCVATLVATGLFNASTLMDSPRDLIATDYGRLLLTKLGLFAGMIVVATVNRYRLTPRAAEALAPLRRNSLAEAALGLGVLALVGVLGTLPPGGHNHAAPSNIPATAAHQADGSWIVRRLDFRQTGTWTVVMTAIPEIRASIRLEAAIIIQP